MALPQYPLAGTLRGKSLFFSGFFLFLPRGAGRKGCCSHPAALVLALTARPGWGHQVLTFSGPALGLLIRAPSYPSQHLPRFCHHIVCLILSRPLFLPRFPAPASFLHRLGFSRFFLPAVRTNAMPTLDLAPPRHSGACVRAAAPRMRAWDVAMSCFFLQPTY